MTDSDEERGKAGAEPKDQHQAPGAEAATSGEAAPGGEEAPGGEAALPVLTRPTLPKAGREHIVQETVYIRGANRPFGELTVDDARSRADELRAAAGFGPTARVAPVARAWRELMMAMESAGAATVADLEPDVVVELAPKLWIVPPGGSLI